MKPSEIKAKTDTRLKKQSVIIMASNKKEAKERAYNEYRDRAEYVAPYRYASKGNNFYEFEVAGIQDFYKNRVATKVQHKKDHIYIEYTSQK